MYHVRSRLWEVLFTGVVYKFIKLHKQSVTSLKFDTMFFLCMLQRPLTLFYDCVISTGPGRVSQHFLIECISVGTVFRAQIWMHNTMQNCGYVYYRNCMQYWFFLLKCGEVFTALAWFYEHAHYGQEGFFKSLLKCTTIMYLYLCPLSLISRWPKANPMVYLHAVFN